MSSKRHVYSIGDYATYQDSRVGEVIDVKVNEDNNSLYLVDFKNSCGWFLAKDLDYVETFDIKLFNGKEEMIVKGYYPLRDGDKLIFLEDKLYVKRD